VAQLRHLNRTMETLASVLVKQVPGFGDKDELVSSAGIFLAFAIAIPSQ
jgi:hypothetical protein